MEKNQIPTILVNGFMDAGKTTYIIDCLKNDYFCKRHDTLLLLLEDGDVEYDEDFLRSRRTSMEIYSGQGDVSQFIDSMIENHQPDRLYLEMNALIPDLLSQLPDCLKITFSITIIDGRTLPLYYRNLRQQLQDMVKASHQVIIHCPEKEMLAPFANVFRIMNQKAIYLWEAPEGYHEKAFGVMVPFDLNQERINLTDADFTPFYLDALEAPEHYEGKTISFLAQIRNVDNVSREFQAGRTVMTCCMADIQFLSIRCQMPEASDYVHEYDPRECHARVASKDSVMSEEDSRKPASPDPLSFSKPAVKIREYAWIHLTAECHVSENRYRQKQLLLQPVSMTGTGSEIPDSLIRLV